LPWVVSCGGRGSGWGWRSRWRLRDQEQIKSWEDMGAADGTFSCDAAPVNRLLDLRSGLLRWARRGEMAGEIRMNGGIGP